MKGVAKQGAHYRLTAGGLGMGHPTPHPSLAPVRILVPESSRLGSLFLLCFKILALGSLMGEGYTLELAALLQQGADGWGITSSRDKGPGWGHQRTSVSTVQRHEKGK